MRVLPVAVATKHHSAPQPTTPPLNHYAMGPLDVSYLFSCIPCFLCFIPVTQTPPLSGSLYIICTLPLSLLVDKQPFLTLTLTTHEVPPMYSLLENHCLISSVSKHAARPNPAIHYPLFVPHQLNLPRSQLSIKG